MLKVAHSSKHHSNIVFIGRGDYIIITY